MGASNVRYQEALRPSGDRQPWHEGQRPLDESDFLRGLFDGMRCGVLSITRGGQLVLINDLAAQILELKQVPQPGACIEEALASHPQLVQMLRDAFRVDCPPNREELELGPGPGQGKILGFTVSLVSSADDDRAGAAIFFKDLTQIEQKEEQERLRDRLAALGQMAASLAHEIRNPLAAIEVTCSLLKRGGLETAESRAMLDKITAEVRRLNKVITSSLAFVRPVSLAVAETPLVPLLQEAVAVALEHPEIEATVETRFPDDELRVAVDASQIRQVFENLVLNAVQASGAGGHVIVEASVVREESPGGDATDSVVVRVQDNGPGVPEDEKERVFYPFFTTKKHGSGIGLSMAKKIVDCHRGLIHVSDSPTGGAQFTVHIPRGQRVDSQ